MQFAPPPYLRSAHFQTVLASRLTRAAHLTSPKYEAHSRLLTLQCADGVRLQARVNTEHSGAPLAILLHGWLGDGQSAYVRRTAAQLDIAGYNVARLYFRDHGDTAHLNEELFHSARLQEVLEACNALCQQLAPDQTRAKPGAIIGFSLGGNFTLRLAGQSRLHPHIGQCIAICPAVDPTTAAQAIDGGWRGYQWYFVQRWQKALAAKAAAFPKRYDFSAMQRLNSVDALTDYFVEHHTPFASVADYYSGYQVTPTTLAGARPDVSILAAADDPVIPVADIRELAQHSDLSYTETRFGGHCGFITNAGGASPVAGWVVDRLQPLPC